MCTVRLTIPAALRSAGCISVARRTLPGGLVLGIDPGAGVDGTTGWAIVDVRATPRPTWRDGGRCTPAEMRRKLEGASVSLVVIERPKALHNPAANGAVIECTWVGGELAGWIRRGGVEVVEVGPEAWRMALIGRPRRGTNRDKLVASVLDARVAGIPRTNVHARDALGVALVGWEMWARGAA